MPEYPGRKGDLGFLKEEADWLKTCHVTHHIREAKGRYWVDMIFTDAENPLRKLVRPITHLPTREKAERYADILQRQIRADPRDPVPEKQRDADDIHDN